MNKTKTIFFLIFILNVFNIPIIFSQYGENEYLYQDVDNLINNNDWGYNQSIALNTTNNNLELEYLVPSGNENFSIYTEVDNGNDLTITDNNITITSIIRNIVDYIHYDYGINYFGDFVINFTFNVNDIEAGDGTGADCFGFLYVANNIGTVIDLLPSDSVGLRIRQESDRDDLFRWGLFQRTGGVSDFNNIQPLTTDNPLGTYYCNLQRVGSNIDFWAYTNSARTVLNAHLDSGINGDNTAYRYMNIVNSIESAGDGNDYASGWLSDLDLNLIGGYVDSGYIFRNNILNNTGVTLVDLLNVTIPVDDNITIQYSPDNMTWAKTIVLVDGLNSIELRDLNYTNSYAILNMTDSGIDSTPQLHQFRSIIWNKTSPAVASTIIVLNENKLSPAPIIMIIGAFILIGIVIVLVATKR